MTEVHAPPSNASQCIDYFRLQARTFIDLPVLFLWTDSGWYRRSAAFKCWLA